MAQGPVISARTKGGDSIRRALAWWSNEILALVPPRLRLAIDADPHRLSLLIASDRYELFEEPSIGHGTPRTASPLAHGEWANVKITLQQETKHWGPLLTVAIRVPEKACLIRSRDLPLAALRHADDLLVLDLENGTPFRREEVYWGWHALPSTSAGIRTVRQIVLKRSRIDPTVERLTEASIRPVAIEVLAETGAPYPVNLWPKKDRVPSLERNLRKAIAASAIIAMVLTLFVSALVIYRQQQAIERLENEKELVTTEAHAVRLKRSRIDAERKKLLQVGLRKARTPSVLRVWEELTRRLPESAWVTDVRLDDGVLTMDGFAHSASDLIVELAKSPFFSDVAFASPVIEDTQHNSERFQIRARLRPATTPSE